MNAAPEQGSGMVTFNRPLPTPPYRPDLTLVSAGQVGS